MANYRKYAENLIGNWNTDQYEPKREVKLATYQTDWDKLQNDFNNYIDKLNRNFDRARTSYYDTLSNIDKNSFLRVNSAVEELAKRGMLNSGLANRYNQANTTVRGQETNEALDKIVNTNTNYADTLSNLVDTMASGEGRLGASLAADLGKITDREAANNQGYQNLAASLAGNAEARELNNALVSARIALSNSGQTAQDAADEEERRILIYDTLRNEDMSDTEKIRYLAMYLDVPEEKGKAAVKAYNDNAAIDKYTSGINKAYDRINTAEFINTPFSKIKWSDLLGTSGSTTGLLENLAGAGITGLINGPENSTIYLNDFINRNRINKYNNELNNLSYTDLYNLLYGNE